MEASEDSSGNVYVWSQESRVDLPNIPVLGSWGAWICVSMDIQKEAKRVQEGCMTKRSYE